MCEAPCGVLSYIVAPSAVGVVALQPLIYLAGRPTEQLAFLAQPHRTIGRLTPASLTTPPASASSRGGFCYSTVIRSAERRQPKLA